MSGAEKLFNPSIDIGEGSNECRDYSCLYGDKVWRMVKGSPKIALFSGNPVESGSCFNFLMGISDVLGFVLGGKSGIREQGIVKRLFCSRDIGIRVGFEAGDIKSANLVFGKSRVSFLSMEGVKGSLSLKCQITVRKFLECLNYYDGESSESVFDIAIDRSKNMSEKFYVFVELGYLNISNLVGTGSLTPVGSFIFNGSESYGNLMGIAVRYLGDVGGCYDILESYHNILGNNKIAGSIRRGSSWVLGDKFFEVGNFLKDAYLKWRNAVVGSGVILGDTVIVYSDSNGRIILEDSLYRVQCESFSGPISIGYRWVYGESEDKSKIGGLTYSFLVAVFGYSYPADFYNVRSFRFCMGGYEKIPIYVSKSPEAGSYDIEVECS